MDAIFPLTNFSNKFLRRLLPLPIYLVARPTLARSLDRIRKTRARDPTSPSTFFPEIQRGFQILVLVLALLR